MTNRPLNRHPSKRRRAAPVSPPLTLGDAVEIHRRSRHGEAQHEIAAAFRVNQGRISEVLSGKRWPQAQWIADNA